MAYFGEYGVFVGEWGKQNPEKVKKIVVLAVIVVISALIAIFLI